MAWEKNVFVILFLAIRECIDEPRGINRGVFCERCRPIKRRTLRKNASRRSARGKSDRAVHNGRKKRYCCKKKKKKTLLRGFYDAELELPGAKSVTVKVCGRCQNKSTYGIQRSGEVAMKPRRY